MSKLYEKYLRKKNDDNNKLYLFKVGKFYIFLGEDANLISKELGLKLTKFSKLSDKCGFPVDKFDIYIKFIELLKYDCEIVLDAIDYIIEDIKESKDLTAEEALDKINYYRKMLMDNE